MNIALASTILIVVTVGESRAECVIDRDIVRCSEWRLEWIRPDGWELSEQSSYPGILVAAIHRRGSGRITVAAQDLADPNESLESYVKRNRIAMQKVGFRVGTLGRHATGARIHEAVAPDGTTVIRQGYFVKNGTAYVVTLAAPQQIMRIFVRAFDDSLRNLTIRARKAPPAAPETKPTPETDAETETEPSPSPS